MENSKLHTGLWFHSLPPPSLEPSGVRGYFSLQVQYHLGLFEREGQWFLKYHLLLG